MSNLVAEILLRLIKPLIAVVLAVVLFVIVTATGEPGTTTLFLICFLCASAFILLVQEGPI